MTNSSAPEQYHPWATYVAGRQEAQSRGDRRVGTDHLLIGLLRDPEVEGLLGVSLESARAMLDSLDRSALAAVGIVAEVEAPRLDDRALPKRPSAKELWRVRDRLRLTPAAADVLREAGRPIRRGRNISAQQVLAALMENRPPDPAAVLLEALGVDRAAVRSRLTIDPLH
ncbi:MAG: Clp protease N-terminal domain-containing protein [Acidimicrobiales bacterium]